MIRTYTLTTADRDRWRAVLPASVAVLGSVEFVTISEQQYGGEGRLFVAEAPDAVLAYPFFLRPLQDLPFTTDFASGCFDILTPPYTGPIGIGEWPDEAPRFYELFDQYCREQRIVTEVAHLNPWTVPADALDPSCIEMNREIIYVDLTWSEEQIWTKSLSSDWRRQTKQSRAAGVRVRRAETLEDVEAFHRLHTQTMDRRHALDRYYYPSGFFADIFTTMPESSFFVLAEYEERVVAGGLFFQDATDLYWDLSAADLDFALVRPVNAYVYDTVTRALGQGMQRMTMGAGYEACDGVYRFKAGLSPLRAPFSMYKRVHEAAAYGLLQKAWSEHYPAAEPTGGFFPTYRSVAH